MDCISQTHIHIQQFVVQIYEDAFCLQYVSVPVRVANWDMIRQRPCDGLSSGSANNNKNTAEKIQRHIEPFLRGGKQLTSELCGVIKI